MQTVLGAVKFGTVIRTREGVEGKLVGLIANRHRGGMYHVSLEQADGSKVSPHLSIFENVEVISG